MVGTLLIFLQLTSIPVKLVINHSPPPTHMVCEVDGVHFTVPRRIIERGNEFVLEVPVTKEIGGVWKTWTVRLGLPWHSHLCRDLEPQW